MSRMHQFTTALNPFIKESIHDTGMDDRFEDSMFKVHTYNWHYYSDEAEICH